jgi:hypothetical protein
MSTPLRIVIPDGGSLEEILSFNDGANEEISDEGGGDHEAAAEQVRSERNQPATAVMYGVPIAPKRRITTAPDASSSYKTKSNRHCSTHCPRAILTR